MAAGVYVIGTRGRLCKIGKSLAVEGRLTTLRTANPFELYVVAIMVCHPEDLMWRERYYHVLFQSSHVRGEWYSLTEAETDYLRHEEMLSVVYDWEVQHPPGTVLPYRYDLVPLEWRGPFVDTPQSVSLEVIHRSHRVPVERLPGYPGYQP